LEERRNEGWRDPLQEAHLLVPIVVVKRGKSTVEKPTDGEVATEGGPKGALIGG
jgi:hypothetical protein